MKKTALEFLKTSACSNLPPKAFHLRNIREKAHQAELFISVIFKKGLLSDVFSSLYNVDMCLYKDYVKLSSVTVNLSIPLGSSPDPEP
jgi:hypothetical protein